MTLFSPLARRPLLLHIPKTGGTWLNDMIRTQNPVLRKLRIRRLGHDYTLDEIDAQFGPETRFGFVFRDPVARLHSAFDSRRNCSQPTRYIPWREAETRCFSTFKTFDEFARAFDGHDPDRAEEAERALKTVRHFYRGYAHYFGSADRLATASSRVIMCLNTSNLSAHLDEVSRAFRLPAFRQVTKARSHSSANFRTVLSPEGRDILAARLTDEYDLYRIYQDLEQRLHPLVQHEKLKASAL
ncbi:sulfotransferase family 2 domain-containing protein [Celeribacter sp. PS-C1]|uniref:sulfotransferase family 2 domain-containing protein n=1 Tax=Celeribacter sp. PS-C1 TaxID=2820813 RepID=UPI001CA54684|nr:sulfotransferase family 2 domain-containing protein [Celeribacter sp. PS-C1]